jgi:hypothetical protein
MIKNTWKRTALPALLPTILMLSVAMAPALTWAQAPADETPRLKAEVARLKAEIQRAEADIRRTDSLAREEQATAARNRERLARDRERREKENAALEGRVRETRGRAAAERARGESYTDATAEIQAREKSLTAYFATVADSLLARVESGLPWDVESRRDRILSLKRDIEAGSATPEEAFARLVALLREETKGGDEVTLSSRPLTRQTGEVVNAQVLKIGNQAIVYADDEGKKFGILEPRETGEGIAWAWRENLDLSERNAVKRAVAVKAGREAPQLSPLTIPLAGLVAKDVAEDARTGPQTSQEGGR